MYNLQLSEEQLAIRDTVRDFVAAEITPVALQPIRLEPFDPPLPLDLIERRVRWDCAAWRWMRPMVVRARIR